MADRLQLVRDAYRAFRSADRELIERLLSDDFVFYSPPDPGIDRAGFFERCWPHAGRTERFEFERLVAIGDEVLVTYEATRTDGSRFRNTEIFGFDEAGERIRRQEVYFGWDL
jgi:ketosteroid isomerase-like protein